MKTRIISFFLSLLFLSIISLEYTSNTAITENASAKSVESVMEKRVIDKFIDDTYLLSSTHLTTNNFLKIFPSYEEVFYTFKSPQTLFRPPIHA